MGRHRFEIHAERSTLTSPNCEGSYFPNFLEPCRTAEKALMAVIVAVAVTTDGRREILGITVMPSEAETVWADFLLSLTRRGLRGVQLVISDAHAGLKAAAHKALDAGYQR